MDLVGAWPGCTRKQFAGLMGGVTVTRADQLLRSLMDRDLALADASGQHCLSDAGLTYVAHRDRTQIHTTLDRWSPQRDPESGKFRGSQSRKILRESDHQRLVTHVAAMAAREAAASADYVLTDLMPSPHTTLMYFHQLAFRSITPDASGCLWHRERLIPFYLEVERRAVTRGLVSGRLKSYSDYYFTDWPRYDYGYDHTGAYPVVLFVLETPRAEETFLEVGNSLIGWRAAPALMFMTTNLEVLESTGFLGPSWLLDPTEYDYRARLSQFRAWQGP